MADVEMKPADTTQDKPEDKKDVKEPTPPPTPAAEIKANIALIEKAVWSLEPRFTHRVLRSFTALKKKLDDAVLRGAIQDAYSTGMYRSLCALPLMFQTVCRFVREGFVAFVVTRSYSKGSYGHRWRFDHQISYRSGAGSPDLPAASADPLSVGEPRDIPESDGSRARNYRKDAGSQPQKYGSDRC